MRRHNLHQGPFPSPHHTQKSRPPGIGPAQAAFIYIYRIEVFERWDLTLLLVEQISEDWADSAFEVNNRIAIWDPEASDTIFLNAKDDGGDVSDVFVLEGSVEGSSKAREHRI